MASKVLRRSSRLLGGTGDVEDPLSGMANLFDLGMVFALALMVALVSRFHISDLITEENTTFVKNPGKENMEIIVKEGRKLTRYKASEQTATGSGKGKRVGTAYEMDNGEVIYIPE